MHTNNTPKIFDVLKIPLYFCIAIHTKINLSMCNIFLANIMNNNLVIHTKDVVSEMEVNLFSLNQNKYIITNLKLSNSNYFTIEQQLEKGRYKLTVNIENKIITKNISI